LTSVDVIIIEDHVIAAAPSGSGFSMTISLQMGNTNVSQTEHQETIQILEHCDILLQGIYIILFS
jgi:hypothetical protein